MIPEAGQTPDVAETSKTLKEKLGELADKVQDKLEDIGEKMEEVADKLDDLSDRAEDALDDLKEKVADKLDDLKDAAADLKEQAAEKWDDLKEAVSDKLEERKEDAPAQEEEPAAEPVEAQPQADETKEEEPKEEEPKEEEPKEAGRQVDLATLTLAELSERFDKLSQDDNRMARYKEAEAIKSAFYKRLSKEKAEAGFGAKVDEPSSREDVIEEAPAPVSDAEVRENPFSAIEMAFKGVYANYKRERAEYNRQQDARREDNYAAKQAVIESLKALVEAQEDVSSTFPAFRELQNRWREIGPVPASKFRDLNDSYQYYVEKFYDMVKINRELRDLDFKKNLEAKQEFCEAAERLAENENVVAAFHELQKLHEQWKEFGPVAKEFRDSIWDRFKAATAVINKRYQAHFEGQKEKQQENLEEKTLLCEQVEAIAQKEVNSSNEWNALSSQIEEIQKKWRTIGFATKKDNQKIYERFRAACDTFFARKREYYARFKNSMTENMEKKLSLIEQAEALKDSKEWKKTTEALIALQKQWKEIGAVPRKKSEQLWKRFREACDAFFDARDKNAKPENDYYANLKAKRALIDEIKAFEPSGDEAPAQDFLARWQAIGFVPFKEKESVQAAFTEAMQEKFPTFQLRGGRPSGNRGPAPRKVVSEKDRLVQAYNKLQQDIVTYENNIGFFSASKNSEPLIKQMQERIHAAKQELKALEDKIRTVEASEEE